MKTPLVIIFILILLSCQTKGQPCRQVTISDSAQQKVLSKYISESVRKRYFINDKGVVTVTRFTNEAGRPSWLIETIIDDSYKDNPPIEWASFGRDVILFYDTKTSRYDVVKRTPTLELIECINRAVGDRLYIRPPKQERLMEVPSVNGKTRKINARRIFTGNANNGQIIIFEKDGSFKILQSV